MSDLVCAVDAIHRGWVLHKDIRMPNVLWNKETKRVMIIEFEGAEIVEKVRQALLPISPNWKRKRALRTKEIGPANNMLETMKGDPRIRSQVELDILSIRALGEQALHTIQGSAGVGSK